MDQTPPIITPSSAQAQQTLARNLAALKSVNAEVIELLLRTPPRPGVVFTQAGDGAFSASVEGRQLASRVRPLEEAQRLAETIDPTQAAAVVVLGFGLGHHARALARRLGPAGVLLVFEPDLPLLRSVLETIDHSAWLSQAKLVFFHNASDRAALSAGVGGVEGLLAMGTKILEHPPSRWRLGESAQAFAASFAAVMGSVRTGVATTMVQVEQTIENVVANALWYTRCDGIFELHNCAKGQPAIVVSAGPSLQRNIGLLREVGNSAAIIAVQTVLKPLLERGIKPHLVASLDYSSLSARFYEGLTAGDVEGVTLVAEPKCSPAIMHAYPGLIRCPHDERLHTLLGPELARPMGAITAGATVAHLCYYLARFMGCDPVILVGQDLAFTDGQYYSAGAAIHQVWSGELNGFNTLEMLEWQRIVRGRHLLHRASDHLGRKVYTDEQMQTYRMQFERDFRADVNRGLRVIDATEGGVRKEHTTISTLAEALAGLDKARKVSIPAPRTLTGPAWEKRRGLVIDRLRGVRGDVWKVGDLARRARGLLEKMRTLSDTPAINRLIEQTQKLGEEAKALSPAHELVQYINQTGMFNRVKIDRAIDLEKGLTPEQERSRRIERDITNVTWLADAAEALGGILDQGVTVLRTGELPPPKLPRAERAPGQSAAPLKRRVAAIIPVHPGLGALGNARDLGGAFIAGLNPLRLMLGRLERCRELDLVVLLTHEPERVRALAGPVLSSGRVRVVPWPEDPLKDRRAGLAAGRLWSRACWRGGVGNLSVYDEAFAPEASSRLMEEMGLDACVVVGADWAFVDPGLADECVRRYRARPESERFTFVQAACGLGAALVDRQIVSQLAQAAGPTASLGALLGYLPFAPQSDPIAKSACVVPCPSARDLPVRCIPDSPAHARRLAHIPADADSRAIAAALSPVTAEPWPEGPEVLRLSLTSRGYEQGLRALWHEGSPRGDMPTAEALRLIGRLAASRPDACLSLEGAGDALLHPDAGRIVGAARDAGLAGVHLRTDLNADRARVDELLSWPLSVISVDVLAGGAESYRVLTGRENYQQVLDNFKHLLESRAASPLAVPWIVPRLTRCDRVYEELEFFYDRGLVHTGACVIDPPPRALAGERVAPLPVPEASARARIAREAVVRCDGLASGAYAAFFASAGVRSELEPKPEPTRAVA